MKFQILTTDQLIEKIKKIDLKNFRKILQLHIHHTWKPDHSDYNSKNGLQLQDAMKNYHMNILKWSDIGQHLTLLPDGLWVTGRDFNKDPASIQGWNIGAFAIEMLGNFDVGHDKLEGKQLESLIKFSAFFIDFFDLNIDDIKFHRDSPFTTKSCPGSSIDKEWYLDLVKKELNDMLSINFLGKKIELEDYIFQNNKNYVQIRELFEKIGFGVIWNQDDKIVEIKLK